MDQHMTTKEAIDYVVDYYGITSMYALAKRLNSVDVKVQPIQISNYLKGTKMSAKVAGRFKEVFDINITDVYVARRYWSDVKDGINE